MRGARLVASIQYLAKYDMSLMILPIADFNRVVDAMKISNMFHSNCEIFAGGVHLAFFNPKVSNEFNFAQFSNKTLGGSSPYTLMETTSADYHEMKTQVKNRL